MEAIGNFSVAKSNGISISNLASIRDVTFRAWARFLNEYSMVRYALTASTDLNEGQLR